MVKMYIILKYELPSSNNKEVPNFQFSDPLELKKLTFPNPQKLYRYSPCLLEHTY